MKSAPLTEALLNGEPVLRKPGLLQALFDWQTIFYVNVFFACISFSIVMPSLWMYMSRLNSTRSFYAWVVASYSVGEAVGSSLLGALSNRFGTKRTLLLCTLISLVGAVNYALAEYVFEAISEAAGPLVVLGGRFLQGVGSGGEQAVEQAYLSIAAPAAQRTSLTSKLSTFACLGFIFGPTLAAAISQLPRFDLGPLSFNSFTMQGWAVALLNLLMLANTLVFEEVSPSSGAGGSSHPSPDPEVTALSAATDDGNSVRSRRSGTRASGRRVSKVPVREVWSVIAFFFVHFNGFAVQETITTPLVEEWFGWGEFSANLLFVGAGVINLLCAVLNSYLSAPVPKRGGGSTSAEEGVPRVEDRLLLLASFALACAGWLLMVPLGEPSVCHFLLSFALVTVAFPFGRGLCLAMAGKLLGNTPQGGWMGVMLSTGAIARIAGPFWAVHGFYAFGPIAIFGSTSALFLLSLAVLLALWSRLSPPSTKDPHPYTLSPRSNSVAALPHPPFVHEPTDDR